MVVGRPVMTTVVGGDTGDGHDDDRGVGRRDDNVKDNINNGIMVRRSFGVLRAKHDIIWSLSWMMLMLLVLRAYYNIAGRR